MGGRLALINIVMDSIPTYFMPLFPMPGKTKATGGLGIREHNKSLLFTWLWRYGMEDNSLWKEVVAAKHVAQNREGNQWSPLFRRNMNDWELESLFDLMCNLEGFNMKTRAAEALSCGPNAKEYTVQLG
ncbi:hypothetical protein MTR67_012944 [Solanum verrucosum]|uniref:Uncharacterized protein n=1 Tax=Solanum verrucosum TaxID=315347 RepID=A0AAF0Q9J7_SOLVR|nr:hypothetical protein MTR67_012944 [Solanum verrucosum]